MMPSLHVHSSAAASLSQGNRTYLADVSKDSCQPRQHPEHEQHVHGCERSKLPGRQMAHSSVEASCAAVNVGLGMLPERLCELCSTAGGLLCVWLEAVQQVQCSLVQRSRTCSQDVNMYCAKCKCPRAATFKSCDGRQANVHQQRWPVPASHGTYLFGNGPYEQITSTQRVALPPASSNAFQSLKTVKEAG